MRILTGLFILLALGLTAVAHGQSVGPATAVPPDMENGTWTVWGTATDLGYVTDDALWFGGAGQVARWDKATGTLVRFDGANGLAISAFSAFAEDGTGASIVAGPEGFYTIDNAGSWRFTRFPAAVEGQPVDGAAAHPSGIRWFSHGLHGPISRYDRDGWRVYPNAETAIEADYTDILGTTTSSDVWTVHDSLIWWGYRMYDGAQWHVHVPDPTVATWPTEMVVTDGGTLFARDAYRVYQWDESGWTFVAYGTIITPDGHVWQLNVELITPSIPPSYSLQCTYGCSEIIPLSGPFLANYSIADVGTIWSFGSNWIHSLSLTPPYTQGRVVSDDHPFVSSLDMSDHGELLVFAWNYVNMTSGDHIALEQVDDLGTTAKRDDVWSLHSSHFRLDALTMTAQGNLWSVEQQYYAPHWLFSKPPHHIVGDQIFAYPAWPVDTNLKARGIFAQGENLAVFDTTEGIFIVDNRGTFDRFEDDRWRVFPAPEPIGATDADAESSIPFFGRSRAILSSNGELWYRGDCTVYHWGNDAWTPILDYCGIFDLVPGQQGEVFGTSTVENVYYVHVIWPNGVVSLRSVEDFVHEHRNLALELRHTNGVWAVAPDGAVWYRATAVQLDGEGTNQLVRDDGWQTSTLEVPATGVGRMAIDAYNHVWIVSANRLWRYSPEVALSINAGVPPLAQAGATIHGKAQVTATENFSATVALSVEGAPPELTIAIEPSTRALTALSDISVTVAPTCTNGIYTFTVTADAGPLFAVDTRSVIVVDQVHETHLPLAR